MNSVKSLFTNRFIHFLAAGVILNIMPTAVIKGVVLAQGKKCECEFSSKDYHAYGTGGTCGIFMYNKGHTCEISFAGTGANKKILKRVLGNNAWEANVNMTPQLFQQHMDYTKSGDKGLFLDSSFISDSLIVLVRGAIFRESVFKADLPLMKIDSNFLRFSTQYSRKVAATFQGKEKPFAVAWDEGMVFFVGEGYVEMNYRDLAIVRAVYFSTLPR